MQGEPSDSISLRTLRARTANAATPMDRVESTSSLTRAASRAAQRRQFLAANAGSSSLSASSKGKGKERDSDADDVDLLGSSQSAPAAREDETRLLLGEGEADGDFDAGWRNGNASTSDARVREDCSAVVFSSSAIASRSPARRASAARAGPSRARRGQASGRSL